MLPIVLAPQALRVGAAGAGDGLRRRLKLLEEAGVRPALFEERLPSSEELTTLNILFIAGLEEGASSDLARAARAASVLVNVEDRPKLCDFHVPAQIRRGDLLITVSTGGRSPGLAARMREHLEEMFGPEWETRLDELATTRARWRAKGMAPDQVGVLTRDMLEGKGWLE